MKQNHENKIEDRIIKRFRDVFIEAHKEKCSQSFLNNLCGAHMLVCAYICGNRFRREPLINHEKIRRDLIKHLKDQEIPSHVKKPHKKH